MKSGNNTVVVSWTLPVDKLTAAYMGAHANQYALNMAEWFPGSDWMESFRYAWKKGELEFSKNKYPVSFSERNNHGNKRQDCN